MQKISYAKMTVDLKPCGNMPEQTKCLRLDFSCLMFLKSFNFK